MKGLPSIVRGSAALLPLLACAPEGPTSPATETVASAARSAPSSLTAAESLGTPSGVTLQPGLAAVAWGAGHIDVFARAGNNDVWLKMFHNGSWQPWSNLNVKASSPVAAASGVQGHLDLMFRDPTTSRMRHRIFNTATGWSNGPAAGSSTIPGTALTAASWGPGRIDVFQRGNSNELRHISFENNVWASDWKTEDGTAGNLASAPSVTAWGPNRLDVFWKNASTGALQHWWFNGIARPLDPLASDVLASAPAAASRASNKLDILYLSGSSTNTLFHQHYSRNWGAQTFDLSGAKEPALASWGPGRLDLFFQDSSNALKHVIVPSAPVLTRSYDNARTGANLNERELDVDNVASSKFGRLFEINLDGSPWGQPLYVPTLDLTAQGFGIRNVLYVTTASNSVYMADADTGQILTKRAFANAIPVPFADFTTGTGGGPCLYNLLPQVGITSTPVIDLASKTMLVVSVRADRKLTPEPIPVQCPPWKTTPTETYRVQLHALDLFTLADKRSPVDVTASSRGLQFNPRKQLQRPGLLLANGAVYLAFGSYTDSTPYTGWVISYDAATLTRRNVFATTSNGGLGGIWQSGQGPAADSAGNIYFLTGNGTTNPAASEFAMAALKLSPTLGVLSHFVPFNAKLLSDADLDLASGGVMLVPGTNFVLGGGKESFLYLMDRSNLGGFDGVSDKVVYEDQATFADPNCGPFQYSNIHGTPVFWQSPTGGKFYLWGEEDFMRAYSLSGSTFVPAGQSATARAPCGMPGGFLSVSANNSVGGTGIVWGTVHVGADSVAAVTPGRLWAFNAETQAQLFSADINTSSEKFAKMVPPTIANGKVYVAAHGPASNTAGPNPPAPSYSGKVIVYGLTQR